jgi:hypothetical protein
MVKNTRKPAAARKPKHTLLPLSSPILSYLAKRKLIRKTPKDALSKYNPLQLSPLVN